MWVKRTAIVTLLLGCGLVLAADEELPELEFLEYLGSWEESDEDWLLFDEPVTADAEELFRRAQYCLPDGQPISGGPNGRRSVVQ